MHFFPFCLEACGIPACALGALDFSWKASLRLGFSHSLADLRDAVGGDAPQNFAEGTGPSSFVFLRIGFCGGKKRKKERKQRLNRFSFGTMHAHLN